MATAQNASAQSSAPDTVRAATAYDRGASRYRARDFSAAAEWFELADRLDPSPSAALSAVRAYRDAGTLTHLARAATLALGLRSRYPTDGAASSLTTEVLREAAQSLGRVRVTCDGCRTAVDGLSSPNEVFLTPGAHRLTGHFSGKAAVEREIDVAAGATALVALEPPPPPVALPPQRKPPEPAPAPALTAPRAQGLTPIVPVAVGVLGASLGGATLISWYADAKPQGTALVNDARASGTRDVAREEQVAGAETRTTVLLATTIGVCVAALVLTVFSARSWHPRKLVSLGEPAGMQF